MDRGDKIVKVLKVEPKFRYISLFLDIANNLQVLREAESYYFIKENIR